MVTNEKKGVSGAWYLLGGAAIGATLGLLFAPKAGEELREDIVDWGRRGGEQGSSFFSRIVDNFRGKAASGAASASRSVSAAKGRAQDAIHEAREKVATRG